MKQKFSTKWIGSKQKRKQVKYLENAPLHLRRKFMSANLSKELRKKYGRRSFPIRKGDSVKVKRGKFKGKLGKVSRVDLRKLRVSIEGLQTQKKDGTKINVYFSPSKIQIQELNLEDKRREGALKRKVEVKEEKEKEGERKKEKVKWRKENASKEK